MTTSPAHAHLTRVHAETLEMLFRGYTTKEIAAFRCRAPKTVEHTLRDMMIATDTRNSRELIYEALSRGWIAPPVQHVSQD